MMNGKFSLRKGSDIKMDKKNSLAHFEEMGIVIYS
jgi:hypothetical protein